MHTITTASSNDTLTSIFLAAGSSSRFGSDNKLLAKIDDTPMCALALQMLLNSSVNKILVVTGFEHELVETTLTEHCNLSAATDRVQFVHNPLYESGMGSSIAAGMKHVGSAGAVIACLSDMPGIPSDVIDTLISAWHNNPAYDAFVPTFQDRRGNPVLLTRRLFDQLSKLKGDMGARLILEQPTIDVLHVSVTSGAILHDVDSQSDLEQAIRRG